MKKVRLPSLYGIRDAAMNWTAAYTRFALSIGFEKGSGCPCNFFYKRGFAMTVHGNDFTSTGSTKNLQWLKAQFESKCKITAKFLGPEPGQEHEIPVLNRIMRGGPGGIVYEHDQRHVEMVVRELGIGGCWQCAHPWHACGARGCERAKRCSGTDPQG